MKKITLLLLALFSVSIICSASGPDMKFSGAADEITWTTLPQPPYNISRANCVRAGD